MHWNIFTSVFLLFLDLLGHLIYFTMNTAHTTLCNLCLRVFLLGIGPVFLCLTLVGSLTDSINYNKVFCKTGCLLSVFFRDVHTVILFLISMFGLICGLLYLYELFFIGSRESNILGMFFKSMTHENHASQNLSENFLEIPKKGVNRTFSLN